MSLSNPHRASLRSYTTGFLLSLALTLIPFYLVINHTLHGTSLLVALAGFAISQLIVQLQFFIHLGHEDKPRWSAVMFLLMITIVLIVVVGSIWIMKNLDYNTMTPRETETKILEEEGRRQ